MPTLLMLLALKPTLPSAPTPLPASNPAGTEVPRPDIESAAELPRAMEDRALLATETELLAMMELALVLKVVEPSLNKPP